MLKKSLIGRSALAIESELFTSESERDISLVSAKTPITAYFNRNNTLNNDSDADDENGAIQQNYQTHAEPGFQEQAFIARKAKDKKKTRRLVKTTQQSPLVIANEAQNKKTKKKLEKDTATISRFSQELMERNNADDTEEADDDDYFTDLDGTSSINNPSYGLMSLLENSKRKL